MKRKHRFIYSIIISGWLLGVHRGYIALWEDGSTEPIKIFPYRAALLPDCDREKLEAGIQIDDPSTLTEFLEDYLS